MILIILLVGILSLSSISAAEADTDSNLNSISDTSLDVSNEAVTAAEPVNDLSGEVADFQELSSNISNAENSPNPTETSSNDKNSPIDAVDGGTIAELQSKIDAAQEGDIINLENNYINDGSNTLKIDKRLTIEGHGFKITDNKNLKIIVSADNVTINNITFDGGYYNGNYAMQQCPIKWEGNNGILANCTVCRFYCYSNIVVTGNNNTISNLYSYYCYDMESTVKLFGEGNIIDKSEFNTNYSPYGVVLINGSNSAITHSNFYNIDFADHIIHIGNGTNTTIDDIYCWKCHANYEGILIEGNNTRINNSVFQYVEIGGGSGTVRNKGDVVLINNTKFLNCTSRNAGSAIYSKGNLIIENSIFSGNKMKANYTDGGAIYNMGNTTINNCTFNNHIAKSKGGAIYTEGALLVNNSKFNNNSALAGGAIFTKTLADMYIENSEFNNNNASYGGGAVSSNSEHAKFINSTFTNNHANYGGAISTNNPTISNCQFYDNTATSYGGALMTYRGNITDSVFSGNTAKHANAIATLKYCERDNLTVNSEDVIDYDKSIILYSTGTGVFCCESSNQADNKGCMFDNLDVLNSRSGINVADKVKIAIYLNCIKQIDLNELSLNHLIYWYTDEIEQYKTQFASQIAMIEELYNSGFRVKDSGVYPLENGSYMVLTFKSSIHASATQNNIWYEVKYLPAPNLTVEKITLTVNVSKGNLAKFAIVVKNIGGFDLDEVYVEEVFPEELKYVNFEDNSGKWQYKGSYKWSYSETLKVGESANFTVLFNTTKVGNFTNLVIAGSNTTNQTNSTNNTTVVQPKIKITQVTANTTLTVGDKTNITLVVKNDGDAPLTDIYIEQTNGTGLDFDNFDNESGLWVYDGESRWLYLGVLQPGESANFTITFKATEPGAPTISFSTGTADEEVSSSENETFKIDEDTIEDDDDDDNKTSKDTNKTKKDHPKKDKPKHDHKKTVKAGHTKEEATGNPIIALFLSLIVIAISTKRGKK